MSRATTKMATTATTARLRRRTVPAPHVVLLVLVLLAVSSMPLSSTCFSLGGGGCTPPLSLSLSLSLSRGSRACSRSRSRSGSAAGPESASARGGPLSAQLGDKDPSLQTKYGGYTAKQRLREEVESPFRTLRLFFFGSSTGSALTALYFSSLSAVKAAAGPGAYPDAPALDEALANCAVNAAAAAVCAALTYRDWRAGEANLERIAKGGALARLAVVPATSYSSLGALVGRRVPLRDYRRNSRVVIAAGGRDYLSRLALSLNADQRADRNVIADALADVDVVLVPVLLLDAALSAHSPDAAGSAAAVVGDTRDAWMSTTPASDSDRNFDITRSNKVLAFPCDAQSWSDYLDSEVRTATKQGFDVLEKGFNIVVKKNGRILRRATGLPQWDGLVGTMEVMDGSRFGMPGDSERYGGP